MYLPGGLYIGVEEELLGLPAKILLLTHYTDSGSQKSAFAKMRPPIKGKT